MTWLPLLLHLLSASVMPQQDCDARFASPSWTRIDVLKAPLSPCPSPANRTPAFSILKPTQTCSHSADPSHRPPLGAILTIRVSPQRDAVCSLVYSSRLEITRACQTQTLSYLKQAWSPSSYLEFKHTQFHDITSNHEALRSIPPRASGNSSIISILHFRHLLRLCLDFLFPRVQHHSSAASHIATFLRLQLPHSHRSRRSFRL
jgi:hypothetical protein